MANSIIGAILSEAEAIRQLPLAQAGEKAIEAFTRLEMMAKGEEHRRARQRLWSLDDVNPRDL